MSLQLLFFPKLQTGPADSLSTAHKGEITHHQSETTERKAALSVNGERWTIINTQNTDHFSECIKQSRRGTMTIFV